MPTCTENLIGLTASGVYTMGLIITGCYFSYRARKAPLAFNEASQILVVVTFMAFYAVVMVPLFYMIDDSNVTVRALMRSLPLLFGLWLMLVVLFGPKVRHDEPKVATHTKTDVVHFPCPRLWPCIG